MTSIDHFQAAQALRHCEVFSSDQADRPAYQAVLKLCREIMPLKYGASFDPPFSHVAPVLPRLQGVIDNHGEADCLALVNWLHTEPGREVQWWRDKPFASCSNAHNLVQCFCKNNVKLFKLRREAED